MILVLFTFGAIGFLLLAFGSKLGRTAFAIAATAPVVALVWIVPRLWQVQSGRVYTAHQPWVPQLGLALDMRLDGMAATMTVIVAAIGLLVFAYAASYFSAETPDLGRLAGLLVLFAGGMIGIVQADNLFFLYTCWEITTITSYFLIGNEHTNARARAAALHALLVTAAGGLAMFGGFVILSHAAGTARLSALVTGPRPGGTAVTVAMVLILLGAFTKSAQYPFHAWLPGAMEASTPVSAYLHSATMIKAGVYLIARLTPLFVTAPGWRPIVITTGLVTMVFGGLRALRQVDLKLLLAHGTVSQLGLMVVLFGIGTPLANRAGWMLLVAHAAFKGCLFMTVGIIDRQTGTRERGEIPALTGKWRSTEIIAVIAIASMIGIPLGAGFIAKETAYQALTRGGFAGSGVVLAAIVAGSMLTIAYGVRFLLAAFVEPRRRQSTLDHGTVGRSAPPPTWWFIAPAAVLAAVSFAVGTAPGLIDRFSAVSSAGLGYADSSFHLALWHGATLALLLSAVTFAGGALIVVADRFVQKVLARGAHLPSGTDAYVFSLRALAETARRVTGTVQNGSLPVYSGVILATAATLPIIVLVRHGNWPDLPPFGSAGEAAVATLLLLTALGAAIVRRRFSAAVFLGASGYAMAGLFIVSGAPDLALTQAVVETLSTVVFVLVLRRLPDQFERQSSSRRRILRFVIAGLVGAMVFMFAIMAASSRTQPPVSNEMVARAVPDGRGHNVVNVILVDFRGLDTLGEITVLAVASIGAVALARAGRRRPDAPDDPQVIARAEADSNRRIVFVDVPVQVTFHAIIMVSLWLLFAGHNHPGGGFVGGLLAGSAMALRYVAGGITRLRAQSRFRAWTVLGTGLLIAATTAALPLVNGGGVLQAMHSTFDLPFFGKSTLSSALMFDIGVYITVVGMVLMAFEAFGDDPATVTT